MSTFKVCIHGHSKDPCTQCTIYNENAEIKEPYNGWGNYETWLVALWVDNDQESYKRWRKKAQQHVKRAPKTSQVISKIWTVEESAKFNLSEELKAYIHDRIPRIVDSGMYADLLGAALQAVDWDEVAEKFLQD